MDIIQIRKDKNEHGPRHFKINGMIGCLLTRVHKQPIIALYFESATVLVVHCHLEPSSAIINISQSELIVNTLLIGLVNGHYSDK